MKQPWIVDQETGCWNWTGTMTRGYGKFTLTSGNTQITIGAHRLVWRLYGGAKIGSTHQLDHVCRNRKCVNPEHMEIVTISENNRRKPATRLTEAVVTQIRSELSSGAHYKVIAAKYGLTMGHVINIRERRVWK